MGDEDLLESDVEFGILCFCLCIEDVFIVEEGQCFCELVLLIVEVGGFWEGDMVLYSYFGCEVLVLVVVIGECGLDGWIVVFGFLMCLLLL